MREQHGAPGVLQETTQRQHQQENVVHLAQERNEVGNQVDRRHDIRDRARDEQLVENGDSRVGEESP